MLFSHSPLFDDAAGSSGSGSGGNGGTATLLSSAGNGGAGGTGASAGASDQTASGSAGSGANGGAVVQKPWREGWIAADGKIDRAAYDRLPDHLKGYRSTFEKYDTVDNLLLALGHSESLNGKKGLLPLPADASEADRKAFRDRLAQVIGVPDKPEGYGIKKPDNVPEEAWDGEYVNGVLAIAHKHAASPGLINELVAFNQKHGADAVQAAEAEEAQMQAANVDGLRKRWGANFDGNMAKAFRAAKTLGLDVNDPSLGNHIPFIEALSKVAGMVGEDKLVTGNTTGAGPTPKEKIDAIMSDKTNALNAAYWDANHPRHKEATDLVLKLTQEETEMKRRAG